MAKRQKLPRTLTVSRFSCIDHAEIIFRDLTILTGPQGSGKSVLCKLLYFCQRPFQQMYVAADDSLSVIQFRDRIAADFIEWFPPSAWGSSKFLITYVCGHFELKIKRSSGRGGVKDFVAIELAPEFEQHYLEYAAAVRKERQSLTGRRSPIYPGYFYGLQRNSQRQLGARYEYAYPASQSYIPAGRAFFTTVGKAVAAFEQSRMFDPITAAFGKLYISLRESFSYYNLYTPSIQKKLERVFGGSLQIVKDDMFVHTDDGRRIPLNALSSGQQELLPLWLALNQFAGPLQWSEPPEGANLLYIEEPEAHLFPDAQAVILEVLAEIVKRKESRSQIIVTTHSPYILAKANNLMKAGTLGFRKRLPRQKEVSSIVPKELWLVDDNLAAYAIRDGSIYSILNDQKQISSSYIDQISETILDEFERLLDVVYGPSK